MYKGMRSGSCPLLHRAAGGGRGVPSQQETGSYQSERPQHNEWESASCEILFFKVEQVFRILFHPREYIFVKGVLQSFSIFSEKGIHGKICDF